MKIIACAVAALTLLGACASSTTDQNLEQALRISNGMSKSDVLSIMGQPAASEFYGPIEEWHFCRKSEGRTADYRAVFFREGKVFAMKPYSVMVINEGGNYQSDCNTFVKRGNYKEPDIVREYRIKYGRG